MSTLPELNSVWSRLGGHGFRLETHDEALATLTTRLERIEARPADACPTTIVRTERELMESLDEDSPDILVVEPIRLTTLPTINTPGTSLRAIKGVGTLIRPHEKGKAVSVVRVAAPFARIQDIGLTTEHPLTTDGENYINDVGIEISSDPSHDWSGLVVDGCHIHHVGHGIMRWPGAPKASPALLPSFLNTRIESFCQSGMNLNWQMRDMLVDNVKIRGRVGKENHVVHHNGMWLGNYCDGLTVTRCFVDEVDRHGYEWWNSQVAPANPDGNLDSLFAFNRCGILGRHSGKDGSFGFTVIGNGVIGLYGNHVRRAVGIGFELARDPINRARYLLDGNSVLEVTSKSAACGLSINSRDALNSIEADVSNMFIGRCHSSTPNQESFGVQFVHGCARVKLHNITFEDAGNRHIYTNGNGTTEAFRGLSISNCTHRWTLNAPLRGYNVSVSLQNLRATAVLRDAETWRHAGQPVGYYRINGKGSVITGGAGSVSAVVTANGPDMDCAGQSNLTIDY